MKQLPPSFIKEHEWQKKADMALREAWLDNIVFTWQWWFLVAWLFVPWLVWWKMVDRKRMFEILTYGFMVITLTSLLDAIGVEFDYWEYHYQLVPLLDVFLVYDISVIPVTYMFIYQYFSTWKLFIVAHLVAAGVFAFIAEPLFVWSNIYQLLNWSFFDSFLTYPAVAVFLKYLMNLLKKRHLSTREI